MCIRRSVALVGASAAVLLGVAAPAAAGPPAAAVDLSALGGDEVNVAHVGSALTLADPARGVHSSRDGFGSYTSAPVVLAGATARLHADVVADAPSGSSVEVAVRGTRGDGIWTEWSEAGADGTVTLPAVTARVEARVTLTATGGRAPRVSSVRLTPIAGAAVKQPLAAASGSALSYRVYATREGLTGATTANGHVIKAEDHFVALPSRKALASNGGTEYQVQVCNPANGTCVTAPVWDVGPWNTKDNYWDADRVEFTDLPQGTPEAQEANLHGYNGGKSDLNTTVLNPAGIDLADGTFHDLGLSDNGYVQVSYLWTGPAPSSSHLMHEVEDVGGAGTGLRAVPGAGGAQFFDGPQVTVAGLPDGSAQVMGIGVNGLLYHNLRAGSGSWTGWRAVPGFPGAASEVAGAGLPDGSAQFVAVGLSDGLVYHAVRDAAGNWTAWRPLPGAGGAANFAASKVSIAGQSDGSAQVTALGRGNGYIYHTVRDAAGNWSAWQALPGAGGANVFGAYDVAITDGGSKSAQVVAVGVNRLLYHNVRRADGTWSGWVVVPGTGSNASFSATAVTLAGLPDGSARLFAVGVDGRVYQTNRTAAGAWTTWTLLTGSHSIDVAAAGTGQSTTQVLTING
jgi:hypothetical protein